MKIKSIHIIDGLFKRDIDFINETNLIFSKKNSCGKTTLIRFILYSLGFKIPETKNIKFDRCNVSCSIELDNGKILQLNRPNTYSISVNNEQFFILPEQQALLHKILFGTANKDILNNILGALYCDQEKGWTLLNRGTVIGSIHFNIEELIRGLSDVDCSDMIIKEKQISSELAKYKQMFSIAQYKDSIQQDNLISESSESENNIELQQLMLERNSLNREISRVGQCLSGNKKFMDFVDEMKLLVTTDDGKQITVTKDNVVGLNDSVNYLIAKKRILLQKLSEVVKKIENITTLQKKEQQQLSFFNSESLIEVFDKQIIKLPINQLAIKKAITELENERKEIKERISIISRSDSEVLSSMHKTIIHYANELGVGDPEKLTQKYLFTSNLKELSGAMLHKTVFAFKLGYIKAIENKLGLKLPIILDSPRGKEVDKKNIDMMMQILNRDFKDNQIIIASIFEYKFDKLKKIEITGSLINELNVARK